MKNMKQKEKIKLTIIMIMVLAILSQTSTSLETKTINYKGENISFTPQISEIPLNTTIKSVFKIEREEYEEEIEKLKINYSQELYLINETNKTKLIEKNISKTINKYTISNTGLIEINKSGK